ncbi:MAG: hypothetical protein ABEJ65_05650 [bacterium]
MEKVNGYFNNVVNTAIFIIGVVISPILLIAYVLQVRQQAGDSPSDLYEHECIPDREEQWCTIYRSDIALSRLTVLRSRLMSNGIPYIVENQNLYNCGIQWKLGLAVPLEIRVPEEYLKEVRSLLDDIS